MITCNLLPIDNLKSRARGRIFLAFISLFVFLIGVILYSMNQYVFIATLKTLTTTNQNLQTTLTSVKTKVNKASIKTNDIVIQWQQLMVILDLEERRRDQTRLLVELDGLLPKENSWLMALSNKNNSVSIEGVAIDKVTVSQFLTNLQNAKYFSDIRLLDVTQDLVINNIKLTEFRIDATATFPQAAIIEQGFPDSGLPPRDVFIKAVTLADPGLAKKLEQPPKLSRRRSL